MFRSTLLAGALALALLLSIYMATVTPSYAQSGCMFTLDDVSPTLTEPFIVIDEPDAVKALVELLVAADQFPADVGAKVTRVLLAKITGQDSVQHGYYGLEIDGCLSPPMLLPEGMDVPVAIRLSGKYSFGVFA